MIYEEHIGDMQTSDPDAECCASTSCKVVLAGFRGKYARCVCFPDGERVGVLVDGDQRYTFESKKQAFEFSRQRAFFAPQVTENMHDRDSKGRAHVAKCSTNGRAKLSDSDAELIFDTQMPTAEAVRRFGISRQMAHRIRVGDAWKGLRS